MQLTKWILDSGETFHMAPDISDFIPGLLVETDKYIEDEVGNFIAAKEKGEVQIEMCDNNVKPFIATSENVLLAPDFFDRLFPVLRY